jgi:hypothetical protein
MHDVGKVGTPDHILLKPGRLTDEEMVIMRRHATIGYDILKGSSSPMIQLAAEIALTHHEKFNGSGYPDGTCGEAIPAGPGGSSPSPTSSTPSPRPRPYKKAWELERAVDFLKTGTRAATSTQPASMPSSTNGEKCWHHPRALPGRMKNEPPQRRGRPRRARTPSASNSPCCSPCSSPCR